MTTTRYPQHWLTFTGNQEPESDPIHTLACECAGVDPNDTDADVLQVEDRTAVEAIQRVALARSALGTRAGSGGRHDDAHRE